MNQTWKFNLGGILHDRVISYPIPPVTIDSAVSDVPLVLQIIN
jgi:hypothetical protein